MYYESSVEVEAILGAFQGEQGLSRGSQKHFRGSHRCLEDLKGVLRRYSRSGSGGSRNASRVSGNTQRHFRDLREFGRVSRDVSVALKDVPKISRYAADLSGDFRFFFTEMYQGSTGEIEGSLRYFRGFLGWFKRFPGKFQSF